jgi:hypothetical protein
MVFPFFDQTYSPWKTYVLQKPLSTTDLNPISLVVIDGMPGSAHEWNSIAIYCSTQPHRYARLSNTDNNPYITMVCLFSKTIKNV